MRTAEETTEHRHDPIESALAGLKFVAAGGEQPYRAILSIVETRRRVAYRYATTSVRYSRRHRMCGQSSIG
jgi:hypothetical protein